VSLSSTPRYKQVASFSREFLMNIDIICHPAPYSGQLGSHRCPETGDNV
jgi:hypothetical protein